MKLRLASSFFRKKRDNMLLFVFPFVIRVAIIILVGINVCSFGVTTAEGVATCVNNDAGECSSNIKQEMDLHIERFDCKDKDENCALWASRGDCDKDPAYYYVHCGVSCNGCTDLLIHRNSWGMNQEFKEALYHEGIYDVLVKTRDYMLNEVYIEEQYQSIKNDCLNRDPRCAYWANVGECEKRPHYMMTQCAPSCQTCDQLEFHKRCAFNESIPNIWQPNDLNAMFKSITTEDYYKQYKPVIYSRPTKKKRASSYSSPQPSEINENGYPIVEGGPWVLTLEKFLTDEECDTLIQLGADQGYKQSMDFGVKKFDGSYTEWENPGRTSTNAWCEHECYDNSITKRVLKKIENVTGIPDANSEFLQLLRYEVGQKYITHHDYAPGHEKRPQGVRLLTMFLYLNDVEAGGGTNFPTLGITVMPKKGKALIWPNVVNRDPDKKDDRTHHQALPVESGIKYGANAWLHSRDFKDAYSRNCV